MELVLQAGEHLFLNRTYNLLLPPHLLSTHFTPHSLPRQILGLWITSTLGATLLFFFLATVAFYTYFDRSLLGHPKFLKNQ
ncbi:hypothetical protein HK102_011971, partial [Quaeritorhiza haematococci]